MPEEPTHIMTVEVPMRLDGPFSAVVFRDALTAVLTLCRVANLIVDTPEVTLREVERADR
jgi:hypothetical protein